MNGGVHRGRAATAAGGALLAALALLAGGCSGGDSASSSAAAGHAVDAAPGAAVGEVPGARPSAAPGPAQHPAAVTQRSIAYTAELRLTTKNVAGAVKRLEDLTTAAGGYVSSEEVSRGGAGSAAAADEGATGGAMPPDGSRVVVKVPSAGFDHSLEQLSQLGTVVQLHREAQDLTGNVIDVDSRLQVQRASVDRIRKLMGQAKTITDVTALESELSRREADLESLERQQQELSGRTAMSTITVDFGAVAPPSARRTEGRGIGSAAAHALAAGWHALYATVRGALVVVAALAPFAAVAALVGWPAARLWRRRRTVRHAPAATGSQAPVALPAEEDRNR